MKTITLLQIGDVHFPDATIEAIGDVKDLSFPIGVKTATTLTPMMCVMRAVLREMQKSPPQCILFCGDLTSGGKIEGYQKCVTHFREALALNSPKIEVHVVPGNHDVDRAAVDPDGQSLVQKFAPFQKAWEDIGLPILAVDHPRMTLLKCRGGRGRLKVYSVNSSIGCGEKRYLPSSVRDQMQELLLEHARVEGFDKAFRTVGEILDTPAFRQEDIELLCDDIAVQPHQTLPLVLSHHNLLPQSLLRIEMYTETINAGYVRSRFSKLNRPLLYCHGHIHDNCVESTRHAELNASNLICVSAPEFSRGFNLLHIDYGSKGVPLGCRVVRFTLNPADAAVTRVETRISFHVPLAGSVRLVASDSLPQIVAILPDKEIRFSDVLRLCNESKLAIDEKTLTEVLQEAEWLKLVGVANLDEPVNHWHIRRTPR